MRRIDRRHALDVAAVAWTLGWAAVGWVVYNQVLGLRDLSDSVVVAGQQLHQTSRTIRSFGGIPFVGDEIDDVARSAEIASRSALKSGRESRETVHDVAFLLGLAVAASGIFPVLFAWSMLRFARPSRAP